MTDEERKVKQAELDAQVLALAEAGKLFRIEQDEDWFKVVELTTDELGQVVPLEGTAKSVGGAEAG